MARFLPEYKEIDTRSIYEKIAMGITWVAFLLLIPGTVLGYFAEKSLPGQMLYPLKRGIETSILALESVTPYSRSTYLQTIASNRIQETSDLVSTIQDGGSDASIGENASDSLGYVVFSVQEAKNAIEQIKDPVAKQQATQQLAASVHNYQTQLNQITYTIQRNSLFIPVPTVTPSITSSPISQALPIAQAITPSPTPLPPPNTSSSLVQQIATVQQQLQDISSTLPVIAPTPTISPTLTPTPTILPTPTFTPTPSPKPSPTPTPTPVHHHGDNGD